MTTGDNHKASDSQHRLSDQVSANTSQQQVERTGHLADRLDSDARVKRSRIELLVSEQPRAIMRTFYVTET
jgi:cell division septum initiation protein DivIVA